MRRPRMALAFTLVVIAALLCEVPSCAQPPALPLVSRDPPPVRVPVRVHNTPEGTCVWNCFEMAAYAQGIPPLYHQTERVRTEHLYDHGTDYRGIRYWLGRLKVDYTENPYGVSQRGMTWLAERVDRGRPVTAILWVPGCPDRHAVLVSGLDRPGNRVRYVDPNDCYRDQLVPLPWFLERWTGDAIELDPPPPLAGPPQAK